MQTCPGAELSIRRNKKGLSSAALRERTVNSTTRCFSAQPEKVTSGEAQANSNSTSGSQDVRISGLEDIGHLRIRGREFGECGRAIYSVVESTNKKSAFSKSLKS